MDLQTLWFFIIGFFFVGYFVLDGFDFGVGMSLPFLGKDDVDRRVLINTIGPVWDGNETWLIVAGATLFASFPEWYASMFSGFYLALLIILLALIIRGVSFEYRHQGRTARWTSWFDLMIVVGSALPSFLWGVAFANLAEGVPLDAGHIFRGDLGTLLNPYGILGGLTTLLLFFTHGALFIALKTDGDVRHRARRLASRSGLIALVVAAVFLVWTVLSHLDSPHAAVTVAVAAIAAVALIFALVSNARGREGSAFVALMVTIAAAVGTILSAMFPYVMRSTIDISYSLTIQNASSSPHTLTLLTWLVAFAIPLILVYQGFTYWVFRKRVSRANIPASMH
jgi:cytochrome bd ubiquinol oxidase subunit II